MESLQGCVLGIEMGRNVWKPEYLSWLYRLSIIHGHFLSALYVNRERQVKLGGFLSPC